MPNNTIKILDAILAINPDAQATCWDEDVDTIRWDNGTTPISKEDILAKKAELEAE
jgi:hypothetical protein